MAATGAGSPYSLQQVTALLSIERAIGTDAREAKPYASVIRSILALDERGVVGCPQHATRLSAPTRDCLMRISDAIERVLAARTREALIDAATAGANDVVRTDGVRFAKLQKSPSVTFHVLARYGPAPDPSPSIVRSPLSSPLIAEHVRTGIQGWVSMDDLLPGRSWSTHPLYLEAYRPLGLRAQISCALRVSEQFTYSLSLNRAGRDFDNMERDLLGQYRRLVCSVWVRIEELEAVRSALASLHDERDGDALLVFTSDPSTSQVLYCTQAMRRLLSDETGLWEIVRRIAVSTAHAGARVAIPAGPGLRLVAVHTGDAVVVHALPASLANLTNRERQILAALADGRTAHAIGHQLAISEGTVRKHLEHLYAKMGVHDRLAAVTVARRAGLG